MKIKRITGHWSAMHVETRDFTLKPGNNTMADAKLCRVYCEIDMEKIMRWYGARALGNKTRKSKQLGGWIRISVHEIDH